MQHGEKQQDHNHDSHTVPKGQAGPEPEIHDYKPAHHHPAPDKWDHTGQAPRKAETAQTIQSDVNPGHAGQSSHNSGHSGHPGGHDHFAHSPDLFRKRFWPVLILTLPVLAYSHHIQTWFRFHPPDFPGSEYLPFILGSFIFIYGGAVFLRGGRDELKMRKPGMMTLISLAISVAFVYSFLVTLGLPGEELYWELATLVAIMLLGHWLEMNAIQKAQGALQELAKLLPETAWLLTGSGESEVRVDQLNPGDLILVRPGGRLPVDGRVVQGESYVNEALLTGESQPLFKGPGDPVIAGTLNEDGSLRVEVDKTAGETTLAGIMRLVEQAQSSRSRTQALADRAAYWLTLIAISAALVTALAWIAAGAETVFILERVVTVLVIACPHALGLAIPLVVAISTTMAARNGLLIKDRLALEKARFVDCVVFDKTGTLTTGELELTGISVVDKTGEDELLRLAAAAELDSEHSAARSIVEAARMRGLSLPRAVSFEALPGRGIRALVEGREVYVGGPNLLELLNLKDVHTKAGSSKPGHGQIYVLEEGHLLGTLSLSDTVRGESREAVETLRQAGVKVVMLTGDSREAAESVAATLGIDQVLAEVLPENKAAQIRQLKDSGYTVAMVGDGVNDAPALAEADVGLAIGAGTDVAVESAGIILVKNDPRDVMRLILLSRAVTRKMIQNLAWATGYNLLALPLAAGILAPVGFVLPMAVGAVVMSASTVIVALNAQMLRRLDLSRLKGGKPTPAPRSTSRLPA